jgi:vacuolar-type H+-ATPase subunit E/Vma4
MSVEGIIARIMSDAEKESDAILDETRRQSETIQSDNRREAEEYHAYQKALLDERNRKEMQRAILNRRLEQRKRILTTRQHWMDRAFEESRRKLIDQPLKEYQLLMKGLISRVSSTKDEELHFGAKGGDADLKALVNELNRETGGTFTLAEKRGDFEWGFVLRKGKVETNMSIDSLFKYKRSDLEQKAWELFDADL